MVTTAVTRTVAVSGSNEVISTGTATTTYNGEILQDCRQETGVHNNQSIQYPSKLDDGQHVGMGNQETGHRDGFLVGSGGVSGVNGMSLKTVDERLMDNDFLTALGEDEEIDRLFMTTLVDYPSHEVDHHENFHGEASSAKVAKPTITTFQNEGKTGHLHSLSSHVQAPDGNNSHATQTVLHATTAAEGRTASAETADFPAPNSYVPMNAVHMEVQENARLPTLNIAVNRRAPQTPSPPLLSQGQVVGTPMAIDLEVPCLRQDHDHSKNDANMAESFLSNDERTSAARAYSSAGALRASSGSRIAEKIERLSSEALERQQEAPSSPPDATSPPANAAEAFAIEATTPSPPPATVTTTTAVLHHPSQHLQHHVMPAAAPQPAVQWTQTQAQQATAVPSYHSEPATAGAQAPPAMTSASPEADVATTAAHAPTMAPAAAHAPAMAWVPVVATTATIAPPPRPPPVSMVPGPYTAALKGTPTVGVATSASTSVSPRSATGKRRRSLTAGTAAAAAVAASAPATDSGRRSPHPQLHSSYPYGRPVPLPIPTTGPSPAPSTPATSSDAVAAPANPVPGSYVPSPLVTSASPPPPAVSPAPLAMQQQQQSATAPAPPPAVYYTARAAPPVGTANRAAPNIAIEEATKRRSQFGFGGNHVVPAVPPPPPTRAPAAATCNTNWVKAQAPSNRTPASAPAPTTHAPHALPQSHAHPQLDQSVTAAAYRAAAAAAAAAAARAAAAAAAAGHTGPPPTVATAPIPTPSTGVSNPTLGATAPVSASSAVAPTTTAVPTAAPHQPSCSGSPLSAAGTPPSADHGGSNFGPAYERKKQRAKDARVKLNESIERLSVAIGLAGSQSKQRAASLASSSAGVPSHDENIAMTHMQEVSSASEAAKKWDRPSFVGTASDVIQGLNAQCEALMRQLETCRRQLQSLQTTQPLPPAAATAVPPPTPVCTNLTQVLCCKCGGDVTAIAAEEHNANGDDGEGIPAKRQKLETSDSEIIRADDVFGLLLSSEKSEVVMKLIATYLDPFSMARCTGVSQTWRSHCAFRDDDAWLSLCINRFGTVNVRLWKESLEEEEDMETDGGFGSVISDSSPALAAPGTSPTKLVAMSLYRRMAISKVKPMGHAAEGNIALGEVHVPGVVSAWASLMDRSNGETSRSVRTGTSHEKHSNPWCGEYSSLSVVELRIMIQCTSTSGRGLASVILPQQAVAVDASTRRRGEEMLEVSGDDRFRKRVLRLDGSPVTSAYNDLYGFELFDSVVLVAYIHAKGCTTTTKFRRRANFVKFLVNVNGTTVPVVVPFSKPPAVGAYSSARLPVALGAPPQAQHSAGPQQHGCTVPSVSFDHSATSTMNGGSGGI